jgi:hypothetical protein
MELFVNGGVIMKQGLYVALVIMTFIFAIVGCTRESTFGIELKNSKQVILKGEKFEKKITDTDTISSLASILNKSNAIDPPEKAKGIKPEVSKEMVMLHFPKEDFFYIGDGYLYYGNNGQYYSVSNDIEKYTTE